MDPKPPADVALTTSQRKDLQKRVEEARAGKDAVIPGDEALAALRERRAPLKAIVEGTGPGKQAMREMTISKLENGRLSLWIHSPGAKEGGYEILVWTSALEAALTQLDALDAPRR